MKTITKETAEWRVERGMRAYVVTFKGISHYFANRITATEFVNTYFDGDREIHNYTTKEHA